MTKRQRRDKESLAKSHRNKIAGAKFAGVMVAGFRSLEQEHPKRWNNAPGVFYRQQSCELSTARALGGKAARSLGFRWLLSGYLIRSSNLVIRHFGDPAGSEFWFSQDCDSCLVRVVVTSAAALPARLPPLLPRWLSDVDARLATLPAELEAPVVDGLRSDLADGLSSDNGDGSEPKPPDSIVWREEVAAG